MKKFFISHLMNFIKEYHPEYNEEKLEVIEYGLISIYLTITKLIVISIVAIILGIFVESLIFTIFYNIIRSTSFGLHATNSILCLISSAIAFIGVPYLCMIIQLPINVLFILGIVGIIFIYKNSPADTKCRPIISLKRRKILKLLSALIATTMVIVSIFIDNNFVSNSLICVILIQSFMISPFAYNLFNLPYDNYKIYLNNAV